MKKWLLCGLLSLAFLVRVIGISDYPIGFTADEASFGYDAYSLIETGKDQWGESWPLTFKSFGDSKLPIYTYLTVPSVAIFGLNEFSTRFPNAIIGTLAVLSTYLMVLEIFKNKKIALLSSMFLTISPWHMALSRGAFEANLTVFFMSMGVWAFYKGIKGKKWMLLSAIMFGFNIFTYHSARLVTPLIILLLVSINARSLGIASISGVKKIIKKHALPIVLFSAFIFLAIAEVFSGGSSRAADVVIFNPTDNWKGVFDRRYEAVFEGLSSPVARIFSNKVVYIFDRFTSSYFTYLSPQFLFVEGPSEFNYGMIPGRGVLYFYEILFVATALWFLVKKGLKENKGLLFLFFWILISVIPAALTKGPGYAGNRAAVMMPAIQVFSAFGAVALWDIFKNKIKDKRVKKLTLSVFSLVVISSFIFFTEDYIYHTPRSAAGPMLYGRKEVVEYVDQIKNKYDEIIISRTLSEPQIFVAFYTKYDPISYQAETKDWLRFEEEDLPFLDMLGEYRLGKYLFRNINYTSDKEKEGTLLVGKSGEFPSDIPVLETIYYPDQKPALLVVDPIFNK